MFRTLKSSLFLVFLMTMLMPMKVYSTIECTNVEKAIFTKAQTDPELFYIQETITPSYGFALSENFENEKIILRRNKGYPEVSTIVSSEFYKKIHHGDLVKKVNDISLKNLTNDEVNKIIFSEKDINKVASIEFENPKTSKIYKLKLKKKNYNNEVLYPEIFIKSINSIDTIKGDVEFNYILTYVSEYPNLYELAEIKKNIEKDTVCLTSKNYMEKFIQKEILIHKNRSFFSTDQIKSFYEIGYDDETKTVDIRYTEKGIARFKSDFDFKKFPFDRQNVSIEIQANSQIEKEGHLHFEASDVALKEANYYKNNNFLKEWKITKAYSEIKPTTIPGYDGVFNSYSLVFEIKRNSLYFLVKIIFPIFLILSIAWYTCWLSTKELESRITTSIVCFLSLVAYNFVIDSDLPKLGYLTYLDWVIMLSYIFCAIPTLLSITLYKFANLSGGKAKLINDQARLYCPIAYFAFLFFLGLFILS